MSTDKAKIKAQAKEIAKGCQVKVVYRNSKGEYFTSENAAINSDAKENIETFDFTNEAEAPAAAEKKYKLTKADMDKYPELDVNGYVKGDEVEELDFAINNKKP